jgi:hypothetical protein
MRYLTSSESHNNISVVLGHKFTVTALRYMFSGYVTQTYNYLHVKSCKADCWSRRVRQIQKKQHQAAEFAICVCWFLAWLILRS